MDADRAAMLQSLIAALRKRWGSRAARLGAEAEEVYTVPTGFPELDAALGIGGLPRGRLTEILGTPTSGATTISLTLLARAQERGDLAGYVDLSRTFDAEYAAAAGVDLHALLLARPRTAADALELIYALVESGGVGVLVVESLALLQSVPRDAALLDQALRILPGSLAASPCALIVLTPLPYGTEMVRALGFGGSALAHAAALRLHVAREAWLEAEQGPPGCAARVTVLKHRLGSPDGQAQLLLRFDDGSWPA
jgi:recombination protein RecA